MNGLGFNTIGKPTAVDLICSHKIDQKGKTLGTKLITKNIREEIDH